MHQSPYLFHSTVYSNVAFGLKARGIPSCRHRELVADVLALVGLKGLETRNSKELSGGEAQRVAIASALVVAPKVLLLDEPFYNLDNEASRLMEELIEALPCQGTTVIVSTHDTVRQNRLNAENIHLVSGRIAA